MTKHQYENAEHISKLPNSLPPFCSSQHSTAPIWQAAKFLYQLMVRATNVGRLRSIPGRIIPKTWKLVLALVQACARRYRWVQRKKSRAALSLAYHQYVTTRAATWHASGMRDIDAADHDWNFKESAQTRVVNLKSYLH